MPTSAGHLADGKTVGSDVWEQRRDTQGQRAHPEWLVPSPSQQHCPHCQKQGTEAMLVAVHTLREQRHKNKTLHDGTGISNDGMANSNRHTDTQGIREQHEHPLFRSGVTVVTAPRVP